MTETLLRQAGVVPALPDTPYVGLVPYSEADAAFFFGRDAEKIIVTANLRAARLTLAYGPSGVGKTSLLQAGVVHDLRQQVTQHAATSPDRAPVAIAVFRAWRDDPLTGLMDRIGSSVREATPGAEFEPWRTGDSVVETLRAWTKRARRLLVVLDQFEDYFLYHPSEAGSETFDTQFPLIVNEPTLRVNFLVSIREDAWAKLDRFEGRIPELFANYVRVDHLRRLAATDAIDGPIAEYNRRLPSNADKYSVEPALVSAVLDAAVAGPEEGTNGAGPAGDRVETPFPQLVMERRWRATGEDDGRARTLGRLERLCGAQRIVERHLVDALGSFDAQEQEIAAEAFRYLVTRSRRRVVQSLSDLAEWLDRPEAELAPVLEKLASGESGRILRPVPPPPGRESEGVRYELFHDVLAEPILDWRRQFEVAREREAEERRQRAVRRRLGAIVTGLLVLVLAFAGLAAWALHERTIASDRADAAESQALAARSLRVQSLAPRKALALAASAEKTRATPQAEEALRRTLVGWPSPTVLVPPGKTTYGVKFSPDGELVASAGGGGARVSETASGKVVATLVPRGLVYSAAFSPDGLEVVTSSADGAVRLWRVNGWRELPSRARILPHLNARAAFSRDGRFLVAGGHPGWPNRIWHVHNGRIGPQVTKGIGGWIDPDGSARVVDARTAAAAARIAQEDPLSAASGPNGKLVAAWSASGPMRVFRTATGKPIASLSASGLREAVFGPNGHSIAAEGADTILWDLAKDQPTAVLPRGVTGGSFSHDGKLFVGASSTKPVALVWDASTGQLVAELPPRPPRTWHQVEIPNPYPSNRAPLTPPPTDTTGGKPSGPGPAFELEPSATFSPDGGLVAAWGRPRKGAQLWQPLGTHQLSHLRGTSESNTEPSLLLASALSQDGGLLATANNQRGIDVWRTREGSRVSTLRGAPAYVASIAFDARGERVASSGFDQKVRVWRVADGKRLLVLNGGSKRVGGVVFGRGGKLLASADEDGTVRIWDGHGSRVRDLPGPAPVASVAFSQD